MGRVGIRIVASMFIISILTLGTQFGKLLLLIRFKRDDYDLLRYYLPEEFKRAKGLIGLCFFISLILIVLFFGFSVEEGQVWIFVLLGVISCAVILWVVMILRKAKIQISNLKENGKQESSGSSE